MQKMKQCLNITPLVSLLFASSLLFSCDGSNGSNDSNNSNDSLATPTSPPTFPPTSGPAPTNEPTGEPSASLNLSLVASFTQLPELSGLFGLFQAPGDANHWYALLREGKIVRFANDEAADSVEVFLDIEDITRTVSEMGLLGLAFHPDFANNGKFFVHYNNDRAGGNSTIASFAYDGNLPVAKDSEKEILTVEQPANNHNGGSIGFGPDGYLYIGFGDGGGGGDRFGNGQNTQSLLAAMLRIDVDSENAPYTIPDSNPFVGNSEFLPEIYAYGLRNPFRWSFDIENGDLWVADVGQNRFEEIHILEAGGNMGWPIMEGNECYNSDNCDQSGLTLPVWAYPHEGGACSVTGGFVYRGPSIPQIQGHYFYADYCNGEVHRLWHNGDSYQSEFVGDVGGSVAGLGQSLEGEIYVLAFSGSILKIGN